ncbi:hypothetical protein KUCAC02_027158 [Chaenocephalus aceratus]|uniref:Uncharacterized protein n=1 Tax=Chaenocephalus aceratus TaxID=36190 RepID=A0ACB9W433_CHAAC|nr:hypothetical protein KUCAC02_027158 [Chaenocephalus aceratus]
MEWKLTRGKFRPRLQQLVASNSEDTVERSSRKAFSLLPDVKAAIAELSSLKGVGPATASAHPIHSQHYTLYLGKMVQCTEKLNKADPLQDWTPHRVEMCLWAQACSQTAADPPPGGGRRKRLRTK